MKIWNTAPLVRLLLPFIAGIFTAVWLPVEKGPFFLPVFGILFISAIIFTFTASISRHYRTSWLYGLLINGLLFLMGHQLTILKTDQLAQTHFSKTLNRSDYVYARIASAVVEKEKSVKAMVEVLFTMDTCKATPVFGKAVVYFQKDARSLALKNGDEFILRNNFREIETAKNPQEFDYRQFLFYKGIGKQAYLKTYEWKYNGKNSGNIIINYALRLRDHLLSVFHVAGLKGDEFAVAAALLIGYTDKLDAELLLAYSGTGVLHVLSVSGMHVAIVFVVCNRILFFLDKLKYGSLVKTLLLLLFLWFYAFLSGLSPSVLRAATMFSFIVFAKSVKRNSTIYNTLAASALFLLLWNPYLIMDVGFQLSYLAVTGIVYLQPALSILVSSDNWLLHQLTELISVSIAAQLATLPVSLYYFHQFPNYFLLCNLVVIPLSTCIIYVGMLLIIVSGNALVFKYTALFFSKTVGLLNNLVIHMSQLPYAITDRISIQLPEMCLLYGLIISVHLFFIKKHVVHLKNGLIFILLLLVFQVGKQKERMEQKKVIVYAVPGISAVDFITACEHVFLIDTTHQEQTWMRFVKNSWCKMGLEAPRYASKKMKTASICIEDNCVQFYTCRLIVLNTEEKTKAMHAAGKKILVDYVILSKNVRISIFQLQEVYHPQCIVFDSSNSTQQIKRWEKECAQLHQTCYSIADSGAFVLEL